MTPLTEKEVIELAKECEKSNSNLTEWIQLFATAITAKLQEKSQGEAIYQYQDTHGRWFEIEESQYKRYDHLNYRIVYLQPQSVRLAYEKAAKICDNYKNSEYFEMAGDIQDEIRALIDQPAEQPAQSQESA